MRSSRLWFKILEWLDGHVSHRICDEYEYRLTDIKSDDAGLYRVCVDIPYRLRHELSDSLFIAIADAAHDWEPEDRDEWDIDVHTMRVRA